MGGHTNLTIKYSKSFIFLSDFVIHPADMFDFRRFHKSPYQSTRVRWPINSNKQTNNVGQVLACLEREKTKQNTQLGEETISTSIGCCGGPDIQNVPWHTINILGWMIMSFSACYCEMPPSLLHDDLKWGRKCFELQFSQHNIMFAA